MRKVMSMMAAVLMFASVGTAVAAEDSCVYPSKIRDFAVESSDSVVVRQAKDTYLRLKVDGQCSLDETVNKIGVETGVYSWIGNTNVSISNTSLVQRVCSKSPHPRVVYLSKNSTERGDCKLVGIEPVTKEDFSAVGNSQINRAF